MPSPAIIESKRLAMSSLRGIFAAEAHIAAIERLIEYIQHESSVAGTFQLPKDVTAQEVVVSYLTALIGEKESEISDIAISTGATMEAK